ncbi:MAG: phenylalanine--tRNA ligase subunit beta [Candidatus Levyibacteriota bacterium]
MLAPLSWLKEYIDITTEPKKLGDKLTEAGLGCEKIIKTDGDTIFELEITPNRPDLLSIIGVAREIAAIEKKKIKYPHLRQGLGGQAKLKKILPLTIKTAAGINPRFTGIIIDNVKVEQSPLWLKKRLELIGQRSINNIVDITNYVMFELGNPIHAFDYNKIKNHFMTVTQAKGGEKFTSVDGIAYRLPKGAVIILDSERIIDLCGIKGGENSGTSSETKTIFIRIPVEVPSLIRRTSQSLGLRSEASSIFERGVNAGGTIDALRRTVDLVQELAGGEIASNLYDIKQDSFKPWKLKVRIERLNKMLGIEIPQKEVTGILESLNLSPVILSRRNVSKDPNGIIECEIPTYRNDLKIEEDLIEEVARVYGYNKFPRTIPAGEIPTKEIPYFKDFRLDEKIKRLLTGAGFSEVYTYSLISEKSLEESGIKPENALRVDNPVSREFEYLRPTMKFNLVSAMQLNKPNYSRVNIFELGKVYEGKTIDNADEHYNLAGISNTKSFYEIKGILQRLLEELGVDYDPTSNIQILDHGVFFEMNLSEVLNLKKRHKIFKPLPKYPPVIEDLSVRVGRSIKNGDIIEAIKNQSPLIHKVSLLDEFEENRTFHIVYQDREKNLTRQDVSKVRKKIIKFLKEKFSVQEN